MSDLISREKLRDDIAGLLERNSKLIDEWLANLIDDVIDEQPTVDAVPVRHGRWINRGDNSWECSECHELSCCTGNYCVDCGAKMDEVTE